MACIHCGAALMPRHFDAVQLHASGYRYCTVRGSIPGTVATPAPVMTVEDMVATIGGSHP